MKKILIKIGLIILSGIVILVLISVPFYHLLMSNFTVYLYILYTFVTIIIFLAILCGIILFLYTKRADLRMAQKLSYYGKPYLIKVNREGVIETFNATCLVNIKDISKYSSVYDFDCVKENFNLMKDIMNQRPFTVCFESVDNFVKYVRFLPVKSGRKFYLVGENISTQQLNFEFHRNLALYHPITELPNKNYFGIKLQELFDDKRLIKKSNSLAALDVSVFRNINKLFGYRIADETLKVLGKLIEESIWGYKADAYHMGEDVFIVLFRNTSKTEVTNWANDFIEILKRPVAIEGNHFNINVNIGIYHLDKESNPNLHPVGAYHNTKLALSKAKASIKTNLVVYNTGLVATINEHRLVEADISEALEKDELYLKFQPQVNNLDNSLVGFEVLLRWNNPKYQFWSPTKFIEIIEETDLILEIGKFVFLETVKFSKSLAAEQIQVSLNISPFQLLHQGFVRELLALYDEHQLKPKQICLEITENFLIESHRDIYDSLRALKNKGYGIRLDNFGYGYSSMLYLEGFPIDGISIHREQIRTVLNDKYSRQHVLNIISLAKSLNLEVIAEGVENEEQNVFLRENGCNIIQGYLYGRPVAWDEAISFFKNYSKQ